MPINYQIIADVVDVRSDTPRSTDSFLVDTNVWYWLTYTRASMADHPPSPYQTQHYPTYISDAITVGSNLKRSELSLAELAHRIEQTELDIYARIINLRNLRVKEFRHNYAQQRQFVGTEIGTAWNQVKSLSSCAEVAIDEQCGDAAAQRIPAQLIDGYDLYILETASKNNLVQIVTDDGDYSSVPGLTVFTANGNVIEAARQQGKLVTR